MGRGSLSRNNILDRLNLYIGDLISLVRRQKMRRTQPVFGGVGINLFVRRKGNALYLFFQLSTGTVLVEWNDWWNFCATRFSSFPMNSRWRVQHFYWKQAIWFGTCAEITFIRNLGFRPIRANRRMWKRSIRTISVIDIKALLVPNVWVESEMSYKRILVKPSTC